MGICMKADIVELVAVPGFDGGAPSSVSIWAILFVVLLIIVCFYIVYRIMTTNERKKIEELKAQLQRENEKEMDLMKQRVLNNVSQELLTPVTLAIGE